MNITKYSHACVVIENEGDRLVIDPGVFTEDLAEISNVVAIVVTHVHADHFDPVHLEAIIQTNPAVQIYSTAEVAENAALSHPITTVDHGSVEQIGSFTLDFFGGEHAAIHESIPRNQNVGVFVNGDFYYPGDSFVTPGNTEVPLLALPVSAPWLKISEVMDFVHAVQPQRCFPTHNAILSEAGQGIVDNLMSKACQNQGTVYVPLLPGQSVEV